jgi:hypothetical protein
MTTRLFATAALAAVMALGVSSFVPAVSANCGAMGAGAGCKDTPTSRPAPPPVEEAGAAVTWIVWLDLVRMVLP